MATFTGPPSGAIRNKPISEELKQVLEAAAQAAGVDTIRITSGGQDTLGQGTRRTGSTRHDRGRAADLQLVVDGSTLSFTDQSAPPVFLAFVTAAAAAGANGIGAGVGYMGNRTIHVGFGTSVNDHSKLTWGVGGRSANAPQWLRDAAAAGWATPTPVPGGVSWSSGARPLHGDRPQRSEAAGRARHELRVRADASRRDRADRGRNQRSGSVLGTCRPGRGRPPRRLRLRKLPRAGRCLCQRWCNRPAQLVDS